MNFVIQLAQKCDGDPIIAMNLLTVITSIAEGSEGSQSLEEEIISFTSGRKNSDENKTLPLSL